MDQETLAARRRLADEIGAPRLRIVYVGDTDDACLRQSCRPVRHVNRRIRQMLDSLAVTMYSADGVGLAAPQVGIGQRVVVVDAGDGRIDLVNPEIVESEGESTATEGCLSIPGYTGEVTRAHRVRVHALDRDGHEQWVEGEGYLARCLQHEIDHLDGVLFTDKASNVTEVAPETRLRVVYFGSPAFAAVCLEEMLKADVEPVALVTRPQAPVGRGMKARPTAVQQAGEVAGIPVLTPARPRGDAFIEELRAFDPDVIVAVAYGQILPPAVLELPRLGAVNLHPSLLPRWRGAAPIQRALMAGDEVAGVTSMHMAERLDAGDIILQQEVAIAPDDDAGSLSVKLARAGGQVLVRTLRRLAKGDAPRRPQDDAGATYADKLTAADEPLDWARPAGAVLAQVRGLAPRPGATAQVRGQPLKVLAARAWEPGAAGAPPGQVLALPEGLGIAVATGDGGAVLLTRVQPAGRRAMAAAEYVHGARLAVGEALRGA